jgi:hypothetical protein
MVGLPWAKSCFVIGQFAFLPFGKEAISRDLVTGEGGIGTCAHWKANCGTAKDDVVRHPERSDPDAETDLTQGTLCCRLTVRTCHNPPSNWPKAIPLGQRKSPVLASMPTVQRNWQRTVCRCWLNYCVNRFMFYWR